MNLPSNETINTIILTVKRKYRPIGLISANLKIRINVIDTKIPITANTPAFNPKTLMSISNTASGVSGITNSVIDIFDGSANFEILPDALIANKISKIIDIPLAYFFNFGNLFLIPLARIAP